MEVGKPVKQCYSTPMASRQGRKCNSCTGSGELGTGAGILDCPDCGGEGYLPHPSVLVDWRARDIEAAYAKSRDSAAADILWLVTELRKARRALTEVVTVAQESSQDSSRGPASTPEHVSLLQRISVTAGCALSLFEEQE